MKEMVSIALTTTTVTYIGYDIAVMFGHGKIRNFIRLPRVLIIYVINAKPSAPYAM